MNNPNLGKDHTPFKRYLSAEYDDNNSAPKRRAENGRSLPNPRVISRAIFDDNNEFESTYSDLLVYYGQFIAHDMTEFKEVSQYFFFGLFFFL